MNLLEVKFFMRGPYNELVYVQATMNPEKGKSLIVRACNSKTFELSSIMDSDVFPEYYSLALQKINEMTSATFLPSHIPQEYINAKTRIE